MKLTDIMIEQYGVWKDLALPVHPQGMTVIHGPNEAGKSTLMRFIRSCLYGYGPSGNLPREFHEQRTGLGGSLHLKHQAQHYELTRRIDETGKRQFRCSSQTQTLTEQQYIEQLLPVDGEVYESVYTLGLKELRELATLQTEQVSEFIYGSTLGVIGQRLLTAEHRTQEHSRKLIDPEKRTGKLFDLSGQYGSLQEALQKSDQVMKRYRQSLADCEKLESLQSSRRQRLAQMQRERTGYQYLQRVWNPWKRQRELQQEMQKYADLAHFPADGLRQLETLERKLETQQQKLSAQRAEQQQLKKRLEQDRKHYELREHASGVRALIDLKGMVETAERHLAAVSADAAMLKTELDEKLEAVGPGFTVQKLDAIDTSPQAHLQLVNAAKNYQTALSRRSRHRKKYRKVSDANHNRQSELQEKLKKRNAESVDQALKQAQLRLKELEQLAQLRIQETEYEQRVHSAQTLLTKYREGSELPWWGSAMLTLFAMAGGFLIIAGMIKGVQTGWLIGCIYMLMGVVGAGLAWSLRQHFETDDHHLHSKLEKEIEDCQKKLNTVRDQISRLTGIPYNVRAAYKDPKSQRGQMSETELIRQATQKLVELEGMARTQERILKTRKNLSIQRGKLASYQREVSLAQQAWCELLKKLGLRETVRTNDAFQHWQLSVDAMQSLLKWKSAREDVQRQTDLLAMFREQMEQIARRMNLEGKTHRSLTQVLTDWQQLLDEHEKIRSTYLKQREQYRSVRKQQEITRRELAHLQAELKQLLHLGNATSSEEFRKNAQKLQRTGEIRALLADIADQLNSLTREQPELAIVEEDLIRFNPQQTQERIDLLGLEVDELEREIAKSQEELGRQRQILSSLESDTTAIDLLTRQQRVLDQAESGLTDWLAATHATAALSRMTTSFEQRFQPETLSRASHYLRQLTCGRYEQVRTPFGSRDLLVIDERGQKRSSRDLSDGTREQLFLAIRLALVDVLAEDQIELPMVLDDICVNFDQTRTEAAVQTILEFAERRQVLFFTCHQHLAVMFQQEGIEPIWLPGQGVYEPQRLAG